MPGITGFGLLISYIVPPVTLARALPSFAPKQLTQLIFTAGTEATIAAGSLITIWIGLVANAHPFASNTSAT